MCLGTFVASFLNNCKVFRALSGKVDHIGVQFVANHPSSMYLVLITFVAKIRVPRGFFVMLTSEIFGMLPLCIYTNVDTKF